MHPRFRPLHLLLGTLLLVTPACRRAEPGGANEGGASTTAAATEATAADGATTFSSDFEGAITMHTVSPRGGTADITFLTKGGKLRIDMPVQGGQATHSLFDPKTRKVTVIMDSQKMALQMPAPPVAAASASQPPTVTHTGKHETVAGYDCEDWDVVNDGRHSTTCVAKGIAFFDFTAMAGPGSGARSWADELRDKDLFPLRAVELDAAGKEISRMEVTKIEKKPLDDSLFVVPPGFETVGVHGGMGGGLPGMGGGGVPGGAHPAHK